MGHGLEYTAPPWVGPKNPNRHAHATAMSETARRMIEASFEDTFIEAASKDGGVLELIEAARIVSQFIAKQTGDVEAAVARGKEVLKLSSNPLNKDPD